MFKSYIFFAILSSITAINASSEVTDITVSYNSGSYFSRKYCSGSFIRNNSKRYFVSAAHCFKDKPNKSIKTYTYNSKSFKKNSDSKVSIALNKEHYFKRNGDTIFTEVPESTNIKTNTLELSTSRPTKGDYISIIGYPITKGDFVPTKLECEFIGSSVYAAPSIPVSIGRIVKCFTNLKTIGGMSGSPVLDESGDFLGTVSAEMQPLSNIKFEEERYIYIVYNEITNELLEKRSMIRDYYELVMFNPEDYNYVKGRQAFSRTN